MENLAITEHQVVSQYLTDLWKKILGKEVNSTDNFFDLGGNSLTAIEMIMEVQSAYNVELDLETFFEKPYIANLANTVIEISTMVPQDDR